MEDILPNTREAESFPAPVLGPRSSAASKKTRTRTALIAAARSLVFERGHGKISIQDITEYAGVATGTFYNYFVTKQQVFESVIADYRDQFSSEIETTRSRLKDPAMVITATLKFYFYQSQFNQEWLTFIALSGLPGPIELRQSDASCLADIKRGVSAGRFKVEDTLFAKNLIAGMIEHINREIRKGNLASDATDEAVRYILRMLGLPDLVAKALTQSPLPPVGSFGQKTAVNPRLNNLGALD